MIARPASLKTYHANIWDGLLTGSSNKLSCEQNEQQAAENGQKTTAGELGSDYVDVSPYLCISCSVSSPMYPTCTLAYSACSTSRTSHRQDPLEPETCRLLQLCKSFDHSLTVSFHRHPIRTFKFTSSMTVGSALYRRDKYNRARIDAAVQMQLC